MMKTKLEIIEETVKAYNLGNRSTDGTGVCRYYMDAGDGVIERPAHCTTRLRKREMRGRYIQTIRNNCHKQSVHRKIKAFVYRNVLCLRDTRRVRAIVVCEAVLGHKTWSFAFDPDSLRVWSEAEMPEVFTWKPPGEPEREPKTLEELGL